MQEVSLSARAKVNLSLNITGVRDGFHTLDSVVASINLCDTVSVKFNRENRVRVRFFRRGKTLDIPPENSVAKALSFLSRFVPSLGADITVEKKIPLAGGLGGSSADAAAVIASARELLGEKFDDVARQSAEVGSDVPVMVRGGFARMSGVGENVRSIEACKLYLAIACKGEGVSSKDAYAAFDRMYPSRVFCPSDNDRLVSSLACGDIADSVRCIGNALTLPAVSLCPEIGETLGLLERAGALASFMTGSGNCCCGLFATRAGAEECADRLKAVCDFAGAYET